MVDIVIVRKQIKETDEQLGAYEAIVATLKQKQTSLKSIENGFVGLTEAEASLSRAFKQAATTADKPRKLRKGRVQKPNSQLYEDIVREHGRPMHMREILNAALDRGMKQQKTGTNLNRKALQSALSSCKRLENLGGNCWWLVGVPVPDETPATDREQPTMPVALLEEEDRRRFPVAV